MPQFCLQLLQSFFHKPPQIRHQVFIDWLFARCQDSHRLRLIWFYFHSNSWLGKQFRLCMNPLGTESLNSSNCTSVLDRSLYVLSASCVAINSQFWAYLRNYRFWPRSFWYVELLILLRDYDTSILSLTWQEKLMSEKRKKKNPSIFRTRNFWKITIIDPTISGHPSFFSYYKNEN